MNLGLYLRTLTKLRASQIYFQVYYRIKGILPQKNYQRYFTKEIFPLETIYKPVYTGLKQSGCNKFSLLNISHDFGELIDWNISVHGRLWNYHLQYLDFLSDVGLELHERLALLEDISNCILEGSLRLEPYPVSIRLINTLVFFHGIPERNVLIEKAVLKQIDFLESNLEYHILANHFLENLIAMCLAAHFVKDRILIIKFTKRLLIELEEQILPDGAHYERSVMYHMNILNRLMILVSLQDLSQEAYFPLKRYITLMASWLFTFSEENNELPLFQDCARNECLSPDKLLEECRNLKIPYEFIPLKESGYRKFRLQNSVLWINSGNISPVYQPGHSHADLLNFVLHINQIPHIVDTGISTYEVNERRKYERGSGAHNVVIIDEKDQSEMWGAFRIGRRAKLKIINENSESLVSEVYQLCKPEWRHQRSFTCHPSEFVIHDFIKGIENCTGCALFHFDRNITSILIDQKEKFVEAGQIKLFFEGARQIYLEDYKQAIGFNQIENAQCLKVDFADMLITRIEVHV